MLRQNCIVCLSFFTYSFIGWAYESTIWAKAEKKRFINRGYLMGCCCPIYGFVSLLDWIVLHRIHDPVAIFLVAAVLCCILEFTTSWVLEKIFHQRWWDYSNYSFNLDGRISLWSGLFFGAAGLLLVKVVYPLTIKFFGRFPDYALYTSTSIVISLFITDIIITTVSLKHKSNPIEKIYTSITYRTALPFDYLNEACVPIDKIAQRKLREAKLQMRRAQRQLKAVQKKLISTVDKRK